MQIVYIVLCIQYKENKFINTKMVEFDSNIFICGTVRNCEKFLDGVFINIKKIAELFSDYRIIIAYDESKDKTLLKLAEQKKQFGDKLHVIVNKTPLTRHRTINISNARNLYLKRMRELTNDGYDSKYYIAIDMDDVCSIKMDMDVFKRAINRDDKWDSVSFNRNSYYDIWALSIDEYIYSCWGWLSPWEVVDYMREYMAKKLSKIPLDEFIECQSAFNGFAIYKTSMFLNCDYDWRMPKQYMKLEDLLKNQKLLWGVGSVSPLDLQTNEPDCEHRSFHMMAIAKNNARIRISPECLFIP